MHKGIIYLLLFIFIPVYALDDAPVIVNLAECETFLLKTNPDIIAQHFDVRQAKSDVLSASLIPNPVLNLNGDIFPVPGEKFNPNNKTYGASIQLPLETGGKREFRIEKATFVSEAAFYQYLDILRLALLSCRQFFWDALAAQETLKVSIKNTESFDKLVALNMMRFNSKAISGTELWRSQIAANQARLQFHEDELVASLTLNKLALATSTNITSLKDTFGAMNFTMPSLDELKKTALDARPDLKSQTILMAAANSNEKLQNANTFPSVGINLDYSQTQNVQYYGVSVQVPLPIFDRNQGELEKAKLQILQTKTRTEAARYRVKNDIEGAYLEFKTRKKALNSFLEQKSDAILEQSEKVKTSAEFAYHNGSISLFEYLDAVRTYNDIYRAYINVVAQYNKSIYSLIAASGLDYLDKNQNIQK